jgi:hypoxanthine-DNA glycosylase
MAARLVHPLPPFVPEGARVLVLGTFPSPKSRERELYYGNPQNRFWRVMAALAGRELEAIEPAACYALAEELGLALWDVVASCEIEGAADSTIANVEPNDVAGLLGRTGIEAVATTGTKAAALWRRWDAHVTGVEVFALPSTSPANARMSLDALVDAYRVLVPFLNIDHDG